MLVFPSLPRSSRRIACAASLFAASWLAGALGAAPALAQGTPPFTLTHVGTRVPKVAVGESRLLEVRVTRGTEPAAQVPVDFVVVSGGGVSGPPNPRYSDGAGIAGATFTFSAAGKVRIEVRAPNASPIAFNVTVGSTDGGGGTGGGAAVVEHASPAEQSVVLGDARVLEVRVLDAAGGPVAGVALLWTSQNDADVPLFELPGVAFTPTDAAGIARATLGFPAVGHYVITASLPDVGGVRFDVTATSLGSLTPDNRSYQSVGQAFDAICDEVFSPSGPDPTPLCVYMTGALQTRGERTEAVEELTATGLGSQTTAAAAGLAQQLGAVASRLSALRAGALRQSLAQIAVTLDGGTLTDGMIASARAASARHDLFLSRLDESFAQLYAGMDAQDAPAGAPAVAPKRDRPWGFFVNARMSEGEREAGDDETGFDLEAFGVTVGVDRAVGANSFFGLALSSLKSDTDLADAGGELDTDGLALTLYGIWELGESFYVQATGTYGQNEYQQERVLELPVVGRLTANAEFDGDQTAAQLEAGWALDGAHGTATFFGRGNWQRAEVDGFEETGAVADFADPFGMGPANFGLAVEAQELTSLVGEIGVDLSRVFEFDGGLFVPQINASALHEFDDDGQSIRGRFLGDVAAASSFLVFTDEPDRDYFNVGASLGFQFLWGTIFVAYDQELSRDDLDLATANAGLRLEF